MRVMGEVNRGGLAGCHDLATRFIKCCSWVDANILAVVLSVVLVGTSATGALGAEPTAGEPTSYDQKATWYYDGETKLAEGSVLVLRSSDMDLQTPAGKLTLTIDRLCPGNQIFIEAFRMLREAVGNLKSLPLDPNRGSELARLRQRLLRPGSNAIAARSATLLTGSGGAPAWLPASLERGKEPRGFFRWVVLNGLEYQIDSAAWAKGMSALEEIIVRDQAGKRYLLDPSDWGNQIQMLPAFWRGRSDRATGATGLFATVGGRGPAIAVPATSRDILIYTRLQLPNPEALKLPSDEESLHAWQDSSEPTLSAHVWTTESVVNAYRLIVKGEKLLPKAERLEMYTAFRYHSHAGNSFLAARDFLRASEEFGKCISLHGAIGYQPQSVLVLLHNGFCLQMLGPEHLQEAVANLQKVIELVDDGDFLMSLAKELQARSYARLALTIRDSYMSMDYHRRALTGILAIEQGSQDYLTTHAGRINPVIVDSLRQLRSSQGDAAQKYVTAVADRRSRTINLAQRGFDSWQLGLHEEAIGLAGIAEDVANSRLSPSPEDEDLPAVYLALELRARIRSDKALLSLKSVTDAADWASIMSTQAKAVQEATRITGNKSLDQVGVRESVVEFLQQQRTGVGDFSLVRQLNERWVLARKERCVELIAGAIESKRQKERVQAITKLTVARVVADSTDVSQVLLINALAELRARLFSDAARETRETEDAIVRYKMALIEAIGVKNPTYLSGPQAGAIPDKIRLPLLQMREAAAKSLKTLSPAERARLDAERAGGQYEGLKAELALAMGDDLRQRADEMRGDARGAWGDDIEKLRVEITRLDANKPKPGDPEEIRQVECKQLELAFPKKDWMPQDYEKHIEIVSALARRAKRLQRATDSVSKKMGGPIDDVSAANADDFALEAVGRYAPFMVVEFKKTTETRKTTEMRKQRDEPLPKTGWDLVFKRLLDRHLLYRKAYARYWFQQNAPNFLEALKASLDTQPE